MIYRLKPPPGWLYTWLHDVYSAGINRERVRTIICLYTIDQHESCTWNPMKNRQCSPYFMIPTTDFNHLFSRPWVTCTLQSDFLAWWEVCHWRATKFLGQNWWPRDTTREWAGSVEISSWQRLERELWMEGARSWSETQGPQAHDVWFRQTTDCWVRSKLKLFFQGIPLKWSSHQWCLYQIVV